MSARPVAFVAGSFVVLLSSACSYPTTKGPQYGGPSSSPLAVTFSSDPPAAADGTIFRDARLILTFDDYVDPDAVSYGPLLLRSGSVSFDYTATIDFVDRQLIITPRTLLSPATQYELTAADLWALDGRSQQGDVASYSYQVGVTESDTPAPVTTLTWNADIEPILGHCAPFCHSPVGAAGDTRPPTRQLDLTGSPNDPTYGLVGVEALGESGTSKPLLRVAPGDPARSVLLRKLIGGDPHADSIDPAYPDLAVDGRRMPIPLDESQPATQVLSDDELHRIQDWIAGGAALD
ncbi:MAG TPA: Ig-like domain-containing protein [Polyangia bacterium]|jgi:hypothetical protein|nr:Ig-like domain-containing protein [Polyangia bacterium]